MAIILKANKVNLLVSSLLFVFWYHSPNFLDTTYKHVLHSMETVDGQRKYEGMEQQWMSRAKEISPLDILGTRAVFWSALFSVEKLFHEFNKHETFLFYANVNKQGKSASCITNYITQTEL
jgi:hypothetical protein